MKANHKHWAVALAFIVGALAGPVQAADKPLTVVELFTSQGCSSCPPADAYLHELAKRDDVLALSVHVDYWDYIGWKDPFAKGAHGQRQKKYAEKFALRYVYTPQMVVHGAYQSVGSKRREVESQIEQAKALPHINVALRRNGDAIELTLPKTFVNAPIEIITVFYDRRHETKIKRGENGGRSLAYANVVKEMKRVAVWTGEPVSMPITAGEAKGEVCAVILQHRHSRRIIGAAKMEIASR